MNSVQYDFGHDYLCKNPDCGSQLGHEPYSISHARYLDVPEFKIELRWCYSCGKITVLEKSKLYHILKAWRSSFYNFFWFRETGYYTYDELLLYLTKKYKELPGTNNNYRELLLSIRSCFILNVGFKGINDRMIDEEVVWELAKSKLSPMHAAKYATMMECKIGHEKILDWIKQLEILWEGRCDPRILDHLSSFRQKINS